MTLDPPKTDAELLAMYEKQQRSRRATFVTVIPAGYPPTLTAGDVSTLNARIIPPQTIMMPVHLRIPWSALVSDNAKYGVIDGRLIAQKPYRAAKKAIHKLAVDVMGGRPAAACPLAIVARVYVPDNRVHDVVNFSKCVHDALKGSVFTDDQWIHDARWIRAGVDVDAPRCELTISPLSPP